MGLYSLMNKQTKKVKRSFEYYIKFWKILC